MTKQYKYFGTALPLRVFERFYNDLFAMEYQDIVAKTGCVKPCVYNQYRFI